MADVHTRQQRSRNMAAIRSKGNKSTEVTFLKLMRRLKIRGWRRNYRLLGRPDFVFPSNKIAVFVDGCFWHGCRSCFVSPKSNKQYWTKKIQRNKNRDAQVTKQLRKLGWSVVRIKEHELKGKSFANVNRIMSRIFRG